jgi:hypothetical protein
MAMLAAVAEGLLTGINYSVNAFPQRAWNAEMQKVDKWHKHRLSPAPMPVNVWSC